MTHEHVAGAHKFVDWLQPEIDELSQLPWTQEEGFLPLIYRAMLRRQFEALRAMIAAIDAGHGHMAVSMLRPACEEMIWTKYLTSLDSETAERLVQLLARHELGELMKEQDAYAGARAMSALGFSRTLVRATSAIHKETKADLARLGKQLGWGSGNILPSVALLARKTRCERLYSFLYHGTSRFVHFSTIELLRRAWGRSGIVTIGSHHFSDYWSTFAINWGMRLFLDTAVSLIHIFEANDSKETKFDSASIERALGPVRA